MAGNNDAQRISGTVPVLVVGKGSLVSTNIFEEEAGSVCKTNKPPAVGKNALLSSSHMSLTERQGTNAHNLALYCLQRVPTLRQKRHGPWPDHHLKPFLGSNELLHDALASADDMATKVKLQCGQQTHEAFYQMQATTRFRVDVARSD